MKNFSSNLILRTKKFLNTLLLLVMSLFSLFPSIISFIPLSLSTIPFRYSNPLSMVPKTSQIHQISPHLPCSFQSFKSPIHGSHAQFITVLPNSSLCFWVSIINFLLSTHFLGSPTSASPVSFHPSLPCLDSMNTSHSPSPSWYSKTFLASP